MKKSFSYREHLLEDLKNPIEAIAYLNAAIEAGDRQAFLLALRNVVDSQGSLTRIAEAAHLHRVSLHKMLSKGANPSTASLISLFRVLGIRLTLESGHTGVRNLRKAA